MDGVIYLLHLKFTKIINMKALKIIYKTLSWFPVFYMIILSVFLIIYSSECTYGWHGCYESNEFLDFYRELCILLLIIVILSIVCWFPLFIKLMYEVSRLYSFLYIISHGLLTISVIIDFRLNILTNIFL